MPKIKKRKSLFRKKAKHLVIFSVALIMLVLGLNGVGKTSIKADKIENNLNSVISFSVKKENFYADLSSKINDLISQLSINDNSAEINPPVGEPTIDNKSDLSYRFLLIGDSFMAKNGAVGEPLEKELLKFQGVSVKRLGKIGSGLVDTDFFDWYKESRNLFISYKPDFVVILLGNNDVRSFKSKDANGEVIFYEAGTPKWEEAYRQKVRDFLKTFDEEGVTVYWIGLSAMRDKEFSEQIKKINLIYEEETKNFKNIKFISTWSLISDGDDNYVEFLKDEKGLYQSTHLKDGIHLTYFSGGIITEKFIKEIEGYLQNRL